MASKGSVEFVQGQVKILYFEDVPEAVQPGVHVRTVNGVYLTDEQMLEHYIGLVKRDGRLTAKYRNAICYGQDEEHVRCV